MQVPDSPAFRGECSSISSRFYTSLEGKKHISAASLELKETGTSIPSPPNPFPPAKPGARGYAFPLSPRDSVGPGPG